jgi:hypothetical protein
MTNLSKGSTYSAVVPLTAIGFSKHTNLFCLQIPEPEPEPDQLWCSRINLVFQWCLMFDTKLKETSLPCYLTWNLTWKSGFGPYANEHKHKLILFLVGWSGRWWRDRPRTDSSSVSDFGTDFRCNPSPQTSGFQPDFVSRLLAFSSDSQFQLDQLIETP